MTTTPTKDRKFLAGLPTTKALYGTPYYALVGGEWHGTRCSEHDSLGLHPAPDVILSISRAYSREGFQWEWSLKLADGCYARHTAHADTLEAAAAAAVAFSPRKLTFNYIDETTWYETATGRFHAAIDGEDAEIFPAFEDVGYYWNRNWAPAKALTGVVSGGAMGQLSGRAPTVEAAMVACIEAPHRLKSACAALIASLREEPAEEPTC